MNKLNASIIYDHSVATERLIKFSMFYFDEVDIHFPEMCGATIQGLPKTEEDIKKFAASKEHYDTLIDIYEFYNKKNIGFFKELSKGTNININSFVSGRIIMNYTSVLCGIRDENGHLIYEHEKTRYCPGDSPIERMSRFHKKKESSSIMGIIKKRICTDVFEGRLKDTSDGFEVTTDDFGNLLINDDYYKQFTEACDEKITELLCQLNGTRVLQYECLKIYEWFKEYYYTALCYIYNIISLKDNLIVSDKVLYSILSEIKSMKDNTKNSSHFSNISRIFNVLLPDFFDLDYEDVFELRHNANDELIALRYYINSLGNIESKEEVEQIIHTKVNPSVESLKNKVLNMRIGITQKAIRELRNPVAYLPLLSSLVTNVDQKLAAAISLGIMGADLALEYYKEEMSIKSDPLYFTLNLNKKIYKMV